MTKTRPSHAPTAHSAVRRGGIRVARIVWSLGRRALGGVDPVLAPIEWDNDVPPFPVLVGEVARARAEFVRAGATAGLPPDLG
jgi:uncharacterized protein (UPF0276 family)